MEYSQRLLDRTRAIALGLGALVLSPLFYYFGMELNRLQAGGWSVVGSALSMLSPVAGLILAIAGLGFARRVSSRPLSALCIVAIVLSGLYMVCLTAGMMLLAGLSFETMLGVM